MPPLAGEDIVGLRLALMAVDSSPPRRVWQADVRWVLDFLQAVLGDLEQAGGGGEGD